VTEVHLHEDKLFIQLGDRKESEAEFAHWILGTGATNHMMARRVCSPILMEQFAAQYVLVMALWLEL
jgi:hypothetical protein